MIRRATLIVFLVAVVVRIGYVLQIRDLVYFDVPLVDGANYFSLAETIAAGDLLVGREAFWQPPLYPYFLALLITGFGRSLTVIFTIQAAIGALSCALVVAIGRRVFGARAGLVAGLVAALYGPLVHFDAQPLIPVLHLVLVLAGLLFILRAAGVPEPSPAGGRDWAIAGAFWGLAAIATPNVLFAVPAVPFWAWACRRPRRGLGTFVLALALPVGLVAVRNLAVAGEPVLISSNGGINFFIGNNPDYERTIRIRPGGEFERLAQEPRNAGVVGAAAESRYFVRRALAFLAGYPDQALRLYGRKLVGLIAGREIPRNQDAYLYRDTSWILAALLWRFGVALPFGIVAPLALAGWAASLGGRRVAPAPGAGYEARADADEGRRAGRSLLLSYAGAYAVSILIFFPTDRYRLPIVPVLALFAGSLLGGPAAGWRRPGVLACLAAGLVVFNLDAFHPGESHPDEEALNRAYALRVKGRVPEAVEEYRRAIAINPTRIDPHNALGALAALDGRWEDAARHYEDLVALAPDFVEARRSLAQAWLALGRVADARRHLEIAIGLAPASGPALADLCLSYLQEGAAPLGEPYCVRAVEARPDLAETHMALALVARSLRRRDVARREFEAAARLFPPGSRGQERAKEILERMRRRDALGGSEGSGMDAPDGAGASAPHPPD